MPLRLLCCVIHGFVLLCVAAILGGQSFAGTTGILEGTVRDKATREPLPRVNVSLPGLMRGTITDGNGRFEIQNIGAGQYEVRFSHLGHRSVVLKNVAIQPDLRTRLTVDLEPTNVELPEVTVVQDRPLIQTDITGTNFHVGDEEIMALPVDNVTDILHLKPGVTLEGNVRGGRSDEVVYLVDGLPVKDLISGDVNFELPRSSIAGMNITTGGFEPEYGNALSGIVNIVTKGGSDRMQMSFKADHDHVLGGTQTSKTTDFEGFVSGPIISGEMFYVASFNGMLTDTRWWQDFQRYFSSPIEKSYSGFGKVEHIYSPSIRFAAQIFYDHHDWRDYEFDWRFNLDGLPAERKDAYRIAAFMTHTVSPQFFYTASLSRFSLRSRLGSGSASDVPANDPYQFDFFLRYIVSGDRAWWSDARQVSYTGKFDATYRPVELHLIKFGAELTLFDLHSDVVKYEPRKTYFGRPLINAPQLNFTTSYAYRPQAGALYVQDKIGNETEGVLLNIGLRYDFFNPTAQRPAIEAIPVRDTAYTFAAQQSVPAKWKHQFSPRLGAAMQVAEHGFLFVNLGWYFQYPLFDYLYSGLDRVTLAKGLSALTGNPDLDPERTIAYEISLRYSFSEEVVGSVTYFSKQTTNLIDTKTFVPGDSKLAGSYGFAEYVNTPNADCQGIELTIAREKGSWLTGDLSYTFMTTEGTSGTAQDGFYIAQYGLPPAVRTFPLSWDQRHTVKASVKVTSPTGLNALCVAEYHSGRPYTNYPTSTGFEPINGGAFVQNNERMPSYNDVDIRIEQAFSLGFWEAAHPKVYLDMRNAFNSKNVRWEDSNGRIGGELGDPSGYYIGRRTRIGAEIAF